MALNPVYAFFRTAPSLAPVILRIALTVIFAYHGCQKAFGWFGGEGFRASLEALAGAGTAGLPTVLLSAAIIGEVAVVLPLLLGFFTRLAGLVGATIAFGSMVLLSEGGSFADFQLPLAVAAMCLALVLSGGGYLSIDRRLSGHFLPEVGPYSY